VSDATLVGLVKALRRALRVDGEAPPIRTAHRIGYAFAREADDSTEVPRADRIQVATELLVFHASGTGMSTATQRITPAPSARDRRDD
jgi:hypothetical protein